MEQRCFWPQNDTLMIAYHDQEWGVPVFDDNKLFEFIVLDSFQAGLSWKTLKEIPVSTLESDTMSKDLKKRGFSLVGTTICYAFMQAAGMVNDHTTDCFRHKEIVK